MSKPKVQESRFDFRGGRNTSVSPDLLNQNELVDATNVRIDSSYGAVTKRSGTQRIHQTAFPAAVKGVTQWDTPSGKQTVVVSNGSLYYRDGFSFTPAFNIAATSSVARSSAAQGTSAGWTDPDGTNDGKNVFIGVAVDTTSGPPAAGNRLILTVGDPAANNNRDAADDLYTFSFKITADGSSLGGLDGFVTSKVTWEVSIDGAAYIAVGLSYQVIAGIGEIVTTKFTAVMTVAGAPAVSVTFRPLLTVQVGKGILGTTGTGFGSVQCFDTVYLTNNFPVTWTTGSASLSLTDPAFFIPFRASTSGAPLTLYIASGGHYFSWDGITTLTQLDPTASAPLAKLLMAYHTRMFAVDKNFPKTLFWSKVADATIFTTGDKTLGGSALTDFLTGQSLVALEVIGSSLLMATNDSIMRFSGHASDDIVISQDTEGVSSEIGAVGSQALKRYENVAAVMSERGPYVATETYAEPIGEQLNPDWQALDQANLINTVIAYNRNRKELLFALPGASDGGLNKTVYVQSVRLQAWQGPWNYSFGITCMAQYFNASNTAPNVIAGCADGFVRLMDIGSLDDVLYNGTGGSNITMRIEHPTLHFGDPGMYKTLRQMKLQAKLPSGHNLLVQTGFDSGSLQNGSFVDTTYDGTLRDYRVDVDGQGKRCQLVFTDNSAVQPTIHGFLLQAYDMQRP